MSCIFLFWLHIRFDLLNWWFIELIGSDFFHLFVKGRLQLKMHRALHYEQKLRLLCFFLFSICISKVDRFQRCLQAWVDWHLVIFFKTAWYINTFRDFTKFGIEVLWRLQFLEYLRTLSLKFQKAWTKIEVVLTLPS